MNRSIKNCRRILRRMALSLLAAACLAAAVFPVCAAGITKHKRIVKIGAFTSSGYHQKNKDGSIGGYGYEYEMLLAQYADWELTYVEGTWTELQQMLSDGEIDLLGFLISTPERQSIYDYADYPSGKSASCLITKKDNAHYAYEDFAAFDGMRVAYQEKNANITPLLQWCAREGFQIEPMPCTSYEKLAQAVNDGTADAGLATSFYDISGYKIIADIGSSEYFYAVKKGNTELFAELNEAVKDINTFYPDLQTTLYQKYFASGNGRGESFTAEEYNYLATHPTVTVLAGGRGTPFEQFDEASNTCYGFVPDVLKQIGELTGLNFQYQKAGKNREYALEHQGENVISSMTCDPCWAYERGWKVTQPFLNANVSIVTKDKDTVIHTIGLGNENYLRDHVEDQHPMWVIQTYDAMEDRLNAVASGKCDAVLLNSCEADYYMSIGKYHLLHAVITTDISQNIGFGVSRGSNPLLFSILSKAIVMIDSDSYQAMMRDNLNYAGTNKFANLIYTNPTQMLLLSMLFITLIAVVSFLSYDSIATRKKNREVMAATQVKTDFFSRMSHDMRTPMNGILGMTTLSKEEEDVTVLHHNMEQIEASGRYMLHLINDTLDIQKLESGKLTLDVQEVYAKDFLDSLIEMMKPTAQEKGIRFEYENINANLQQNIACDATRIKQVFTNLLSNAMKFTPKGGTVRFTVECIAVDGQVEHDRFCVRDTGIGISEEFMKKGIFLPYSQEDSSITTQYGGTGLGLAISRNIIEAMGGSINVESKVGEGSCFTVLLDFKTSPLKEKCSLPEKKTDSQQIPPNLLGRKILLCEDHPLNAEIAKRLLQKAGCEVTLAADGKIGVDTFAGSAVDFFDAVLMDVRMPNMDGLTATRAIRAMDRADAARIPILAMTANAFPEDILHCKQAGMNAHLAKPVDAMLLYRDLNHFINLRQETGGM